MKSPGSLPATRRANSAARCGEIGTQRPRFSLRPLPVSIQRRGSGNSSMSWTRMAMPWPSRSPVKRSTAPAATALPQRRVHLRHRRRGRGVGGGGLAREDRLEVPRHGLDAHALALVEVGEPAPEVRRVARDVVDATVAPAGVPQVVEDVGEGPAVEDGAGDGRLARDAADGPDGREEPGDGRRRRPDRGLLQAPGEERQREERGRER